MSPSRFRPNRFRNAPAVALLAILALACSGQQPDLNERARALTQQGRWEEAAEAAKQQLLRQPGDIAAHFYLGRCYLNGATLYSGAAEGEFQMALMLFHKSGGISPIEEYDDQYFELRCHLELAKVYLRSYYASRDRGAPQVLLQEIRQKLEHQAEAAERIAPGSEDVLNLKAILKAL